MNDRNPNVDVWRFSRTLALAGVCATLVSASSAGTPKPTVDLALGIYSLKLVAVAYHHKANEASMVDFNGITFHLRSLSSSFDTVVESKREPTGGAPPDFSYFQLSLPNVSPGAYELYITASPALVLSPPGLTDASRNLRSANIFLPDLTVPQPRIGDRYMSTTSNMGDPPLATIWVLSNIEVANETTWKFRRADRRRDKIQRSFDNGGPYDIDGLARIIDDPTVVELSKAYVGKSVWAYGQFDFPCWDPHGAEASVALTNHGPIQVEHIYRLEPLFLRRSLGMEDQLSTCLGFCHDSYHIFTNAPLYVQFKVADENVKEIPPTFFSGHPHAGPYYSGPCVSASSYFVDTWDFERTFSFDDPNSSHPEWPTTLRQAMLDGQVKPGMSHEMVAFAKGFPSIYGTPDNLEKLSVWTWYPGAWHSAIAHFQGDQLVDYSTPWPIP